MGLVCEDEWIVTKIKLFALFNALLPHLSAVELYTICAVEVADVMFTVTIGDDAVIARDITVGDHEVAMFVLSAAPYDEAGLIDHVALLIEPEIQRSAPRRSELGGLIAWR